MSNIIRLVNDQPTTTSSAIADGVGNPHSTVIRLIRDNTSDLEDFGPIGFEIQKGKSLSQGGFARSSEIAILNEQQSMLLLTYMRNNDIVRAFKKQLIKAFFEMRAQLSKRPASPDDLSRMDILQMAMQSEEEKLLLEQENKQLEDRIEEDAPKIAALDRISNSDGSLCFRDAAKNLQMRPIDLMRWLNQIEWVYRRNGKSGWLAYQGKIQAGYLWHKVTTVERSDGSEKITEQARVTTKGLTKLAKLLSLEVEPA